MNKFLLTTTFLSLFFLSNLTLNAQENKQESLPPLHQAVLDNDIEKAKTIIQQATLDFEKENLSTSKPSPFDEQSANNATPMMFASYIGNLDMVKLLHEEKQKFNEKYPTTLKELILNCQYTARIPNHHIIPLFSDAPLDFHIQEDITTYPFKNKIPLTLAVYKGHIQVVDYLLKNNYHDKWETRNSFSPLHIAIQNKDIPIIKRLLQEKFDVNVVTCNGTTPLKLAIRNNCEECAQLLLESGAKISQTDLHKAVYLKRHNIVSLFLKQGVNINYNNYPYPTPLTYAVLSKDEKMISLLIDNNANPNIRFSENFIQWSPKDDPYLNLKYPNKDKMTPLEYAFFIKDEKIYLHLLSQKTFFSHELGNIFKHISNQDHLDLLEKTIQTGVNINQKDNFGNTLLHYAKDKKTVEWLLNNKADILAENEDKMLPFHLINDKESVLLLLSKLKEKNITPNLNYTDEKGNSLLHIAAYNKNFDLFSFWVDQGLDVNQKNYKWETPLHMISNISLNVINGKTFDILKLLIEHQANVNEKNDLSETPLHFAVKNHQLEIVKTLIENKANVNAKNHLGQTPLFFANDPQILQVLIDAKALVNVQDNNHNTSLHTIENEEALSLLIQHKADVNIKNDFGDTPLHWAVEANNLDATQILINNKANVNEKNKKGETPLFFAEDAELFNLLIDAKALVNIQDNNLNTPLHLQEDTEIISLLIQNGADVNAKNNFNRTPLEEMLINEPFDAEAVSLFVNNGADINIKNNKNQTLLHFAVDIEDEELVALLISKGIDVTAIDVNGCTALDIALNNESSIEEDKWKPITKMLLKAGNGVMKDKKEVEHCFIDSNYWN